MKSEREIQRVIMGWFEDCNDDESIIKLESMIYDITEQEKENRWYDLKN